MNPSELYSEHFDLIESVIAKICRRNCWRGAEAEDFSQTVHLKLLENDHGVFRKFKGRSTWSTYLTTVITNHFRDYRTAKWGRWRPSAAAERLGPSGVQLDTLIYRDGHTSHEAIEILKSNYQVEESKADLESMVSLLPARSRRRFEGEEQLERLASDDSIVDGHSGQEEAASTAKVERALAEAMGELEDEDWLLVRMRFFDGFSVAQISRTLAVEQRPLYSRLDRCCRRLRESLRLRGILSEEALAALECVASEIHIDLTSGSRNPDQRSV